MGASASRPAARRDGGEGDFGFPDVNTPMGLTAAFECDLREAQEASAAQQDQRLFSARIADFAPTSTPPSLWAADAALFADPLEVAREKRLAALEGLRFTYQADERAGGEKPGPCCICLEKLADFDVAIRTRCGHLFHADCLTAAIAKANACPMCRSEVV